MERRLKLAKELLNAKGVQDVKKAKVVVTNPHEIAVALEAPLDVLIARKLGAPGQPEVAIGAVASGGIRVFNDIVPDVAVRDSQVFGQFNGGRQFADGLAKPCRGLAPIPAVLP